MTEQKRCAHCKKLFQKSEKNKYHWSKQRFCSVLCGVLARPAKRIPCRICGRPTKYHLSPSREYLIGTLPCERPACRKASTKIARAKVGDALRGRKYWWNTWSRVAQISAEEKTLAPLLKDWQPEFKFVLGRSKQPTWFRFDFAMPERKLYIEIDGDTHLKASRRFRDKRKDRIMRARKWKGLRIPSSLVKEDLPAVLAQIKQFSQVET